MLLTISATYQQVAQKPKNHPPRFDYHPLSDDTILPFTPYCIGLDKDFLSSFTP